MQKILELIFEPATFKLRDPEKSLCPKWRDCSMYTLLKDFYCNTLRAETCPYRND